jgi:hypothetical protein
VTARSGKVQRARNVIEQLAAKFEIEPVSSSIATACRGSYNCLQGYFSVLPEFAVLDEIARGEVVAVPIVDPIRRMTVGRAVEGHLQRTLQSSHRAIDGGNHPINGAEWALARTS